MGFLQNKTVFVTGGAGFIGSAIIDLLLNEEVKEIRAVDNFIRGNPGNVKRALASGKLKLSEGDIRNLNLMDSLVEGSDVVFHQAALRITQCAAEPKEAFEVMGSATFHLLEQCVKHKVERMVVASSASIYGMAPYFPTDEEANPYDNRTLYGALKIFNEGLLRSYNEMYGLPYVALRYFNAYGPRMDIHGKYTEVLIRWMERIEEGKAPIIFGDGSQTMDFVHVDDIARANLLAANSNRSDRVYNVASGTETSLLDLAKTLMKVMGRPDLSIEYAEERKVNPVPRRLADTTRAKEELGFSSQVTLEEGLRGLVGWWRDSKGRS